MKLRQLCRTSAVCKRIRRIRYGQFSLEYALLRKQWTVKHVVDNISLIYDNINLTPIIESSTNIPQLDSKDTKL